MARPTKLTAKSVAYAQQQVQRATDATSLRRALAVLLPAQTGINQSRTAQLLGIGVATVKRYQYAVHQRARGLSTGQRSRGGRRNETVSRDMEEAFLGDWGEQAAAGHVVYVGQLREDLQRRAGRRIPLYTLYRILARHGWRKVAPDTKHPKGDPVAQEAFKKTSARSWLPPGAGIESA